MKKLVSLLSLAAIVMVVASCGNVEKILPKKDGTWESGTTTYREYVANTLDSTYTDNTVTTYTFQKDGTGTYSENGTTTVSNFTWSVNADGDIVTLCEDFLGGSSLCIAWDVQESSGKEQLWMATIQSGVSGTYTEVEATFTRKD
jgi:hypothetical protein